MGANSAIEWCDATWNPTAGCSILSPGCTHCYAMKQAAALERRFGMKKYAGLTRRVNGNDVWTGEVRLVPSALAWPMQQKKPLHIFVNSMSDLFHEALDFDTIDKVFAVMSLAPQHEYQVLTKRTDRMLKWVQRKRARPAVVECMAQLYVDHPGFAERWPLDAERAIAVGVRGWPLRNVLLGVSIEDQARADERREALKGVAAAGFRTFISYEPALGPVDWTGFEFADWIISGGESGPKARPSHPNWHRATRDFCVANGIAYLFKQYGEFRPADGVGVGDAYGAGTPDIAWPDGSIAWGNAMEHGGIGLFLERVGKKAAGRELDGRTWDQFPGAREGA